MKNNCENYRNINQNFGLGHDDNINRLKSKFIKEQIKSLLEEKANGSYEPEKVQESVEEYFNDPDNGFHWNHPEQMKKQAYDTARQILRYVNSETRTPLYLDGKVVQLANNCFNYVAPDEVFIIRKANGEKFYNLVKIKCSKPRISQKKAYSGNADALELFELLKYGQTILSKKGEEHVTASIYYLRKNTDRSEDANELNGKFDSDFFGNDGINSVAYGSGNIVSLTETYRNGLKITCGNAKNGAYVTLPDYDLIFKSAVEKAYSTISASECTAEQCNNCSIKNMCSKFFTEAPLAIEEEKVVARAKRFKLTKEQEQAADFEKGLCRINAGAGAGKTSVVKSHFVSLCNKGYDPEKILVITFTNSGAEEMRTRIVSSLTRNGITANPDSLWIMTFNAFGDLLLKKNYESLGYTASPKLVDDIERSHIIADLLASVPAIQGLDYRNFTMDSGYVKGALAVAKLVFSLAKKYQLSVTEVQRCSELLYSKYGISVRENAITELLKLFTQYDNMLHDANLVEYDDQISCLFELAYNDPTFFDKLGFEHIIVDEFQDTDEQQIDLLRKLIDTPSFKSLMVVGDDSQAIYGFRDTSPEFIINFEKYIGSPITDIYLLENFRSTPEIIDFANKVNDMNISKISKDLISTQKSGDPVTVVGFGDSNEEYSYIVNQIKQNIADGVKPEDIAFIGYSKAELRKMGDLLGKEGITSVMMNPELLQENSRVQAGLALLESLENPADRKALLTFASAYNEQNLMSLSFANGQKLINEVDELVSSCRRLPEPNKKLQIIELLKKLNRNNDEVFESFISTLEFKPTVKAMFEYARDFKEFGANAAFRRSHSYPGVVLTTAHSSKGLEWPYAYVSVSKFDSEEITKRLAYEEERRRLLFVSATRAKKRLVVTGAWVAYKVDIEGTKLKKNFYNKFLLNSFEAIGEEFSDEDLDQIYTAYKARKALKRKDEKEKKIVVTVTTRKFNPRPTRTLRRKGNPSCRRRIPRKLR